jgi:hypothetical protein
MKYHYRIKEVKMFGEPRFWIERTYDNRILILLGWADWYLLKGDRPFSTLEAAKQEIRECVKADKAYAIRAKKNATRYHYL